MVQSNNGCHCFRVVDATKYGIKAVVILYNTCYWLTYNLRKGQKIHDEPVWNISDLLRWEWDKRKGEV